jgi:hypothetical protein
MMGISTLLMVALCDLGGLSHMLGWLVNTLFLGAGNFFIMTHWSVYKAPKDKRNEP